MKQKILHTPEGVRDIYKVECRKKLALQEKLHHVLHLYGYHDIQTPTFEYFDVFRKEIGSISAKELYKFFDREGNILSLRPDITPSVARAASALYEIEELPLRLCYIGNTFINYSSYQGRLRENTQLGAEFIGLDSKDVDAEMLAMVVDCLRQSGLENFQISVGNVGFLNSLLKEAKLPPECEEYLRELISNRNYYGVTELLDEAGVRPEIKELFGHLQELVGGPEVLEKAMEIAPNELSKRTIKRLRDTYEILKAYTVQKYITFDLSMSGTYGYYTGVIFRAYTFGTGDAIVKGGRYNHLMEKFGKRAPSIGFAVIIDELMNSLARQHVQISYEENNVIIVYADSQRRQAVSLAKEFRARKNSTELFCKKAKETLDDYIQYGKKNQAETLLYLQEDGEIEMINLKTGERKASGKKEEPTT